MVVIRDTFVELAMAAREAENKHPQFPENKAEQLAILTEEIGEIAEAINDGMPAENYKREVLDAGAVIVRILERMKTVDVWK